MSPTQGGPGLRVLLVVHHWITFAVTLPALDPRYMVAIMPDAPGGGARAAPLFHHIATQLSRRERLPVSADPAPVQTLVAP